MGREIPPWISRDLTKDCLEAIVQGGCASGAYMPAVLNREALETMNEHGDEIFEYIENTWGEFPKPQEFQSWSGLAVFYVSTAVELWAHEQLSILEKEE